MSIADALLNKIKNSPEIQKKIAENPVRKGYMDVLLSGDQNAGVELANQILNTYGLSKEEGIKQANSGLASMFGGQN